MCRTQNFSGSMSLVSTDSRTSSVFPLINLLHFQKSIFSLPHGVTAILRNADLRDPHFKVPWVHMPSLELCPQIDIQAHLLSLLCTQKSSRTKTQVSGDPALFYFLTSELPLWGSHIMEALWMCEKGGKSPQGPPCSRKINLSNAGRLPGRAGLQGRRWWWRQTGWEK